MQHFMDGQGRRWAVEITPTLRAKVKAEMGMDLPALLEQDMRPLSAVLANPAVLAALLYSLCSEQAAKARVTPGEFAAILSDPMTADEATAALGQAMFNAYIPAAGYVACRVSRHDRARAAIIAQSEQKTFDMTIPRPPDPSKPRVKGVDPELPRRP